MTEEEKNRVGAEKDAGAETELSGEKLAHIPTPEVATAPPTAASAPTAPHGAHGPTSTGATAVGTVTKSAEDASADTISEPSSKEQLDVEAPKGRPVKTTDKDIVEVSRPTNPDAASKEPPKAIPDVPENTAAGETPAGNNEAGGTPETKKEAAKAVSPTDGSGDVASEKPAVKPAAKAPKAPPPPDPKAIAAKEVADRIADMLRQSLGEDVVESVGLSKYTPMLTIRPAHWRAAVAFLRDDPRLALNYFECMAGADYSDHLEVVIYVYSTVTHQILGAKVKVARDEAEVDSITSVYAGANWEEREIFDLLGIHFTGHPDLRRIMLADDWNGHPLRKDYTPMD